jgi:outer membrane protein W
MKKLIAFFAIISHIALAQTAEKDTTIARIKRRVEFAKMYMGVDYYQTTGGSTQFFQNNTLQNATFEGTISPRLHLAATHFWGHADFYVTIPVAQITPQKTSAEGLQRASYVEGVETGFRYFPWAVEQGKLRPFVGVSLKGFSFGQVSSAPNRPYKTVPSVSRTVYPFQAGLWYATKNFLFQSGVSYRSRTDFEYPVSRTEYGKLYLSPWSFNVGMSWWFNTNGGLASKRGENFMKNGHKKLAAKNRLDCWYFGIGPSGTFEMTKSEYVKDKYPFLRQSSPGALVPDVALGRYFHKADLNIGLSYRKLNFGMSGYGTQISQSRRSIMLESYKFLGDYHGFVPYIGPTLSYENLTLREINDGNIRTLNEKKAALGVIFGWDIRISRAESWLLRTNLRYTPNLHLKADGKKVMFDQMEFNFIQLIWFAGRRKALR